MGLVQGRSQFNWEHGIPCRNPACKSYMKPGGHPNCRCGVSGPQSGTSRAAGPSKAITSLYAEGGNVDDPETNFCSSNQAHKSDCDLYNGNPELGKSILKNAIQRHTSEDDLTDSMLGKSKPEQALHGLIAHSGAAQLLGDVKDSLFSESKSKLNDLANKQLSKKASKFINQISMISPDQAMDPELIKDVIRPGVKKLIGNGNPNIVDAVITAISRGETDKLGVVIHHAGKISKGHKSIEKAIESLFGGDDLDQEPDEDHREKLKKFISEGGINAQIANQTQAMNDQPVQMAKGGMINANAPQNPIEKAFPEQSMLLGATKSNVSNYLQSQEPQAAPKLPFDVEHKNTQKEKDYHRALDIANKPLSVLNHVKNGTVTPEHIKHLVGLYPDLYNHISKKSTEQVMKSQLKDERPSYRIRQGLSMFLGSPLDSTMTPQAMQSIQSIYAPKGPAASPPGKAKKGTSKLTDVAKDHFTQEQASSERAQATD